MNTQKIKKAKIVTFAAVGFMSGALAFNVNANVEPNAENSPQLIYQSQSINHNIFSYLSRKSGELSLQPKIIYVSQANGPAIYSYQHSGSEQTVEWNVEYVDTAYNPAIYSYESPQFNGEVKMLPIKVVD